MSPLGLQSIGWYRSGYAIEILINKKNNNISMGYADDHDMAIEQYRIETRSADR